MIPLNYVEITAWSFEEVQVQLHWALPRGWKVQEGKNADHLWLYLLRPNKEGMVIEWENYHFDRRILYLDAYCWLQLRQQPSEVSPWIPRHGELTRRRVTQRVLETIADPEDIDPKEIQAVYKGEDDTFGKNRRS